MVELEIKKKYEKFRLDVAFKSEKKRIGILGASGCGKSLTLKSIAGIERPEKGRIVIDGVTLFDAGKKIFLKPQKRKVGYLFQNYALFPNMTVEQNIGIGFTGNKEDKQKMVEQLIHHFQLDGLEKLYPSKLSGGQQQRTALARIMAYEPDVILLDEPFSALDAYLRERMLTELMEMLSDYEGTVIMVSHSRDEIYSFSEEVLVIEDGHGIRLGPVKEVFNAPRYKTAARLTGCKNIADVYRMDAQTVYVKDWDVQLIFKGRSVPENVKAIGIRAHDLIPVYGTISGAMLKVKEWKSVDYPFERKYFIQCESGCEDFCWFVQREISATLEEKGMPDALAFPEEKVLLEILLGLKAGELNEKSLWNAAGNVYYLDGVRMPLSIQRLREMDAGKIRKTYDENRKNMDDTFFKQMTERFVKANANRYQEISQEALSYIWEETQGMEIGDMFVSFSGGKDSTVTADLVTRALSNPQIMHIFA